MLITKRKNKRKNIDKETKNALVSTDTTTNVVNSFCF